ncbi:MAG: peptidylprolyl isomerase [Candidatus Fermentibacteria bacterium]
MTALLFSILLTVFVPLEKVVAVVDNSPILHSEVEDVLTQMGLDPDGSYEVDSKTAEYLDALDELIDTRLLVNAAIGAGFYPTDDEIQLLVEEHLELNPPGYDADLEYISEVLADNQAAQIFVFRKVHAAMQDMPWSPEAYLLANPELVEENIMPRHLGWIYLPVLPAGPEYDEVMEEIHQLRQRIVSGESFEELAIAYSEDGSGRNGGYLGVFGPGEMTYTFEDAAFALETGEISEPVVTPFGIHIIRLDRRNEDGTVEASHILKAVQLEQDDIENTILQAESILSDIRSSIISFEDAARLYSRHMSSSAIGGDMGMIPLKLWKYEVAVAAEGLEIGDCSEPVIVDNSGGVAIVKLYESIEEIDWNSYSQAELDGLVQQVIYQDTYNSVIDSLQDEMSVIYFLEDEGTSAN